jgi:hypothetical protein
MKTCTVAQKRLVFHPKLSVLIARRVGQHMHRRGVTPLAVVDIAIKTGAGRWLDGGRALPEGTVSELGHSVRGCELLEALTRVRLRKKNLVDGKCAMSAEGLRFWREMFLLVTASYLQQDTLRRILIINPEAAVHKIQCISTFLTW